MTHSEKEFESDCKAFFDKYGHGLIVIKSLSSSGLVTTSEEAIQLLYETIEMLIAGAVANKVKVPEKIFTRVLEAYKDTLAEFGIELIEESEIQ